MSSNFLLVFKTGNLVKNKSPVAPARLKPAVSPGSNGSGHLVLIQEIVVSNPTGVTHATKVSHKVRPFLYDDLVDHRTKSSKKSYFFYILQSESDGTYYTGHTQNLVTRLKQHNKGKSTYTSRHIPYKLIYSEVFSTRQEAMAREKEIKKRGNTKSFLKVRVPSK